MSSFLAECSLTPTLSQREREVHVPDDALRQACPELAEGLRANPAHMILDGFPYLIYGYPYEDDAQHRRRRDAPIA